MARGRFRRRSFRRGRQQVASAFAPARIGGGHLNWEAAGTTCWDQLRVAFPLLGPAYTVACIDGGNVAYTTQGLVLIPINENRGTVTLLRVRGFLGCERNADNQSTTPTLRDDTVHFILQLVPKERLVIGGVDGDQLLSGNLAADMENNRIIMQWVAPPGGEYATPYNASAAAAGGSAMWFREIDVRTKRRFNRPEWALVLSATTTDPSGFEKNLVYANFRMLFRADDGI